MKKVEFSNFCICIRILPYRCASISEIIIMIMSLIMTVPDTLVLIITTAIIKIVASSLLLEIYNFVDLISGLGNRSGCRNFYWGEFLFFSY